jgi:O-antigen ligase
MQTQPNQITTALLAAMMAVVPAVGLSTTAVFQDTLKSALVTFFALTAMAAYLWERRDAGQTVQFHILMVLPLGLMVYAMGSMAWSHSYLGGVEAVRWFVFSLLLFLGLNTLTLERVTQLTWGIHVGAVLAALWAALQFWIDFQFFAQAASPASTFINRNFFAEFLLCTLPFSVWLLTRLRRKSSVFLLTFSLAFNIAALLMTGTRSTLIGLATLAALLPTIVWLFRRQVVSQGWQGAHCALLALCLLGGVAALGSIPTSNTNILAETGPGNALTRISQRAATLTTSAEYKEGSFSVRTLMWKATTRMVAAHPLAGVGAGAWEVHLPRFQDAGSENETDYYVHNEFLQLLAEYGLVGWLLLLSLLAYLSNAAFQSCKIRAAEGAHEAMLLALTLSSLLVFLLISNAGFPWHLASTSALFALSLAILAASDLRLAKPGTTQSNVLDLMPIVSRSALALVLICMALAAYVTQQAVVCELALSRAVQIAVSITKSGRTDDPRWNELKQEMWAQVRKGIAINPHYRRLTPQVADAAVSWGDWNNATEVWEATLASRPYVLSLLVNVASGQLQAGNMALAKAYLERAQELQPTVPGVLALEVMFLAQSGQEKEAATRAKKLLLDGVVHPDLNRAAYLLGVSTHDIDLAVLALQLRAKSWPEETIASLLQTGELYSKVNDQTKALASYQAAFDAAAPASRFAVLNAVPEPYRKKIK